MKKTKTIHKNGSISSPSSASLPGFFNPDNAANHSYDPNLSEVADAALAWREAHQIRPAASDEHRIALLLIDVQRDFCFPEGSLYVAGHSGTGAIEDNKRIASFIYRNLGVLTNVTTTMDTHFAYQIFFPAFWVDVDGATPPAHTVISAESLRAGTYRPNPVMAKWLCGGNYGWLQKQVQHYVDELERAGKYQLYLWPPHCLLGSTGHALAGVIHEARMFHAFSRGAQSNVEVKGGHPLTENYSVLRPEVLTRFDGGALGQRNAQFVETLLSADQVIIAGQAASHCVRSTIDDLLDEITAIDIALAKKVYVLRDCMSAVTVPDGAGGFAVDFTPQAEAAFARYQAAGMHLVTSDIPLADWPN